VIPEPHSRIHIQIGDDDDLTEDMTANPGEKRDYISPVRMRNRRRFSEVNIHYSNNTTFVITVREFFHWKKDKRYCRRQGELIWDI
jgi:hypothetical protein